MKKWMGLFILGMPLFAGCAEFRERQRLKTEMMREMVGMMRGMNGGTAGGLPPGFKIESATPAIPPASH
jgi:hypothetical protein